MDYIAPEIAIFLALVLSLLFVAIVLIQRRRAKIAAQRVSRRPIRHRQTYTEPLVFDQMDFERTAP